MGLFGFGKKDGGIMDTINADRMGDNLIWQWRPAGRELEDSNKANSLRTGSSLMVNEGQAAIFVYTENGGKQDVIIGPYNDTITDPQAFTGIIMSPREVRSFVLHNIYFANGKTHILESSEPALLELFRFLQARPNQCIRIVGHTDNIGSDRSNQILSEGRCQEVRRAMIERGISPDRIQTEGRGKRDPIVPNDSDEHRQMNRRVEIVLL